MGVGRKTHSFCDVHKRLPTTTDRGGNSSHAIVIQTDEIKKVRTSRLLFHGLDIILLTTFSWFYIFGMTKDYLLSAGEE